MHNWVGKIVRVIANFMVHIYATTPDCSLPELVKYFAKYIGDHSIDTCSTFVSMAPDLQRMGQLLINPNPVKNQLTISASTSSVLLTMWRVFNAAGQEVTALVNLVGSSKEHQQVMEVQELPAGVYYLQGLGQTGMATGKFVKM